MPPCLILLANYNSNTARERGGIGSVFTESEQSQFSPLKHSGAPVDGAGQEGAAEGADQTLLKPQARRLTAHSLMCEDQAES